MLFLVWTWLLGSMDNSWELEPTGSAHADPLADCAQGQHQQDESELEEDYNPEYERDRKANDLNLKRRFESIFDKYGRDFDGVGDEIDIETGEVVIDNGHLTHMQHEADTGKDSGLSSRLMREFAENFEHEDDNNHEEENASFGYSSGDDDDDGDSDDAQTATGGGRDRDCSTPEEGESTTSLQEIESDFPLDPRLNSIAATIASVMQLEQEPTVISGSSPGGVADARLAKEQTFEESDSSDTRLNFLATPAVQASMLALQSKATNGVDPKDVEALGMSIAKQIARFIGTGRGNLRQSEKKRKDAAWDYPELPVDKRIRTEVRPQRPRLPQLSAVISPNHKKPLYEPRESLWAPQHHPKQRKTKRNCRTSHNYRDASEIVPEEANVSSQFMDEVIESCECIMLKKCSNCGISATLCWRKGPDGELCNACGMYWYRYGLMKPLRPATPSECETSGDSEVERVKESYYSANTSRRLTAGDNGQKKGRFTVAEDALIIKLKEIDRMTWERLARLFPGRSLYALQCRYSKRLVARMTEGREALLEQGFTFDPIQEGRPDECFREDEDELLVHLREEKGLGFEAIAEQILEKTALALEARYNVLAGIAPALRRTARCLDGMPRNAYHRFSAEEDALLVKLREIDQLTWMLLAKRFPERTALSLQKRYVRELARRKDVQAKGGEDPYAYLFNERVNYNGTDPEHPADLQAASQDVYRGAEMAEENNPHEARGSVECVDIFNPEATALQIVDGSRISKITPETPARYRTRYTKAEDELVRRLKVEETLDWEDIALRLPGRSARALEVRYCAKLKRNGTSQPDDTEAVLNAECPASMTKNYERQMSIDPRLDQLEWRRSTSNAAPEHDSQRSHSAVKSTEGASIGSQQNDQTDAHSPRQQSVSLEMPTDDASVISHDPHEYTHAVLQPRHSPELPQTAFSTSSNQNAGEVSGGKAHGHRTRASARIKSAPPKRAAAGTVWTREERDVLIELRTQGFPWSDIAKHLPGRTVQALQNHWSANKRKARTASRTSRRAETSLLRRALDNGVRRRSEGVVPSIDDSDHSISQSTESVIDDLSSNYGSPSPIAEHVADAPSASSPSVVPEVASPANRDALRQARLDSQVLSTTGEDQRGTVPTEREDGVEAPLRYPETPLRAKHGLNEDPPSASGTFYLSPDRCSQQSLPYYATQPAERWMASDGPDADIELASPLASSIGAPASAIHAKSSNEIIPHQQNSNAARDSAPGPKRRPQRRSSSRLQASARTNMSAPTSVPIVSCDTKPDAGPEEVPNEVGAMAHSDARAVSYTPEAPVPRHQSQSQSRLGTILVDQMKEESLSMQAAERLSPPTDRVLHTPAATTLLALGTADSPTMGLAPDDPTQAVPSHGLPTPLHHASEPYGPLNPYEPSVDYHTPTARIDEMESLPYQASMIVDEKATLVQYDAPDAATQQRNGSGIPRDPVSSLDASRTCQKIGERKQLLGEGDGASIPRGQEPSQKLPPKPQNPIVARKEQRISPTRVYRKGAQPRHQDRTATSLEQRPHTPSSTRLGRLRPRAESARPVPISSVKRVASGRRTTVTPVKILDDDSEDELA